MTKRSKLIAASTLGLLMALVVVGWVMVWSRARVVRVQVETLQDRDGVLHRRWTFTGGRWESYGRKLTQDSDHQEHRAILDRPGSLDSGLIRSIKQVMGSGSTRIVYEIEVSRLAPGPNSNAATVRIMRVLRGNANGLVSTTMDDLPAKPGTSWALEARIDLDADADFSLPASIRLGEFAGMVEMIELR